MMKRTSSAAERIESGNQSKVARANETVVIGNIEPYAISLGRTLRYEGPVRNRTRAYVDYFGNSREYLLNLPIHSDDGLITSMWTQDYEPDDIMQPLHLNVSQIRQIGQRPY